MPSTPPKHILTGGAITILGHNYIGKDPKRKAVAI